VGLPGGRGLASGFVEQLETFDERRQRISKADGWILNATICEAQSLFELGASTTAVSVCNFIPLTPLDRRYEVSEIRLGIQASVASSRLDGGLYVYRRDTRQLVLVSGTDFSFLDDGSAGTKQVHLSESVEIPAGTRLWLGWIAVGTSPNFKAWHCNFAASPVGPLQLSIAGLPNEVKTDSLVGAAAVSLPQIHYMSPEAAEIYPLNTTTQETGQLFWDGANQRLGVGTTSPSAKLDVYGGNANTQIIIDCGSTSYVPALYMQQGGVTKAALDCEATTSNFRIYTNDGSWRQIYEVTNAGNQHDWMIQGSSKMTLDSSGKVGIGTTSPAQMLDVRGNAIIGSAAAAASAHLNIGGNSSGNRTSFIDIVADDTYTTYALRLLRNNGSPNGLSQLLHRGTGALQIKAEDASGKIRLGVNAGDALYIASSMDIGVGSLTPPTANGLHVLFFADNTADPTMANNTAGIYAKDVAGTVEMFAVDEASNVTQISPHDPLTGDWVYYSKNLKTGVVKRVNMERLVAIVEALSGESLMEVSNGD